MNSDKRRKLEEAGWRVSDTPDEFLGDDCATGEALLVLAVVVLVAIGCLISGLGFWLYGA